MIPKIIHYCWFGGNPIPEKEQRCIESWKKFCPDFEIRRWDETTYDVSKSTYSMQAYQEKRWGFVSDYVRFDVVYRYGGIYLDTDVELLKSFDPLLKEDGFAGIEESTFGLFAVAPGLGFGAIPNCEIIKNLKQLYEKREFIHNGKIDLTPSPQIVTGYLKRHGFNGKNEKQVVAGLTIFPSEYFCPQNYTTGAINITKNTYSIHRYSESWKTEDELRKSNHYRKAVRLFGPKYGEYVYVLQNVLQTEGVSGVIKRVKKKL